MLMLVENLGFARQSEMVFKMIGLFDWEILNQEKPGKLSPAGLEVREV